MLFFEWSSCLIATLDWRAEMHQGKARMARRGDCPSDQGLSADTIIIILTWPQPGELGRVCGTLSCAASCCSTTAESEVGWKGVWWVVLPSSNVVL